MEATFAERLKRHQAAWAAKRVGNGGALQMDGIHDWVLRDRRDNYFESAWAAWLDGKAHLWGHALNSSQAFAINLFGPARQDPAVAKALWAKLWVGPALAPDHHVTVCFEYSGESRATTRDYLGEQGQPTQVDVAFKAHDGNSTAILLIEVKLSEAEFGSCRGPAEHSRDKENHTCDDARRVLSNPAQHCWLAAVEKRKYWQLLTDPENGLSVTATKQGRCPWSGGLYQLMRNWSLGRALVESNEAQHVEVAVCLHPWNDKASVLHDPVAGTHDVIRAFNSMTRTASIREIDPRVVVNVSVSAGASTSWGTYMSKRYFCPQLSPK